MVQQVTHNIKVSVKTNFEGVFPEGTAHQYAFSYTVTIENQGQHAVQLKSRFWRIKDALHPTEVVSGEGVIGEQPIIEPGNLHQYSSGCVLASPLGSMQGYYLMKTSFETLEIKIPFFKLSAPFALN